jgi:large subunit ribosomal protein L25
LLTQPLTELSVEAEATHIPTGFEVSVSGFEPGTTIHARDVVLPSGVTLVTDPDAIVLSAQGAPTEDQLEAELSEATADAGGGNAPAAPSDAGEDEAAAETPAE